MPRGDKELVQQAQDGDKTAIGELCRRHGPSWYRKCHVMLGNVEDAKEAVQEVNIAVIRSIERFRGKSAFSTWAYRIVVNVCLGRLRDENAERPYRAMGNPVDSTSHIDNVADPSPDQEYIYYVRRMGAVLRANLQESAGDWRMTAIEMLAEGHTSREIGEALRMPASSVRKGLHRVKQKLRRAILAELTVAEVDQILGAKDRDLS